MKLAPDIIPAAADSDARLFARVTLSVLLLFAFALVVLLAPGGSFLRQDASSAEGDSKTQYAAAQGAAACNAQPPASASPQTYTRHPRMALDPSVNYVAIVHTSCGDIKINLLEDEAPMAVNNFVFLAREGFYDGLVFHDVRYDFIIQAGDPDGQNGTPPDDAGYTVKDELPDEADAYTYGAVGLANRGPDTGGSQFFIVVHDLQGALEGEPEPLAIEPKYTVFGHVKKRFFGSVEAIARQKTLGGDNPVEAVKPSLPVYIEAVQILEKDHKTRSK